MKTAYLDDFYLEKKKSYSSGDEPVILNTTDRDATTEPTMCDRYENYKFLTNCKKII